ncbi:MAG: beta-N-acetylhexosaminidase [Alphaproteobacteria bacterium]|nr:beta-N-acetylhexosaminidase [Alphaproteobacteria bacterium]
MTKIAPVIFGCAGSVISIEEMVFFKKVNPFGFILFARNIINPAQVHLLVRELRKCSNCKNAPVLIDQEGGRVQRLVPPQWKKYPSADEITKMKNPIVAANKNAFEIGKDLAELGINVNCAPVLDVPVKGAHDIIGDRAYGNTPDVIARFGRAVCDGTKRAGVLPIIKHIPGHGRATADSHEKLPIVDTPRKELEKTDFAAFAKKSLQNELFAMTAHVVYSDIDNEHPATQSKKVIDEIIRGFIGFKGILMSDDLSMKALKGSFTGKTKRSLDAGCDLVLHCNGDMGEMKKIANAILSGKYILSARNYAKWLNTLKIQNSL